MKCLIHSVRLWKFWSFDHVTVTEFNSTVTPTTFTICTGQAALFDLSTWILQAKEAMRSHAYSSWRTLVQRCPSLCWLRREPLNCCRSFFHDFSAATKDPCSFKFLIQQWTNFNELFVLFVPSQLSHSECHAFCARAVKGPPKPMQKGKPSLVLNSCTPLMQAHCDCPTVVLTRLVEDNYLILNPMCPCSSSYQPKLGTLQLKHRLHTYFLRFVPVARCFTNSSWSRCGWSLERTLFAFRTGQFAITTGGNNVSLIRQALHHCSSIYFTSSLWNRAQFVALKESDEIHWNTMKYSPQICFCFANWTLGWSSLQGCFSCTRETLGIGTISSAPWSMIFSPGCFCNGFSYVFIWFHTIHKTSQISRFPRGKRCSSATWGHASELSSGM